MRVFLLILATLAAPALADEPVLRPSARLVFKHPAMLQAGQCVVYEEGGSGWVMTDPVYYLKGKVVAAVLGVFLLPTLGEVLTALRGVAWIVAFGMGVAMTTVGHEVQKTPAAIQANKVLRSD